MSGSVKVIIEIPKDAYDATKGDVFFHDNAFDIWLATRNGTPLDTVKAEIADLPTDMFEVYKLKSRALYILDNIGKGK